MLCPLHGKTYVVCQWTGETIPEDQRFQIPKYPKKGGRRLWTGCYGSPGAAVAAIKDMGEKANLNPDQIHELFDEFETTLRRNTGQEQVKFTISAAPDYKLLKQWGGPMGLDEFHKSYQHSAQVEIFTQAISLKTQVFGKAEPPADDFCEVAPAPSPPKGMGMAERWAKEEEDSDTERPSNAPRRWHDTKIGIGRKDEPKRVEVPRGLAGVVEWLKGYAKGSDCKDAVLIYFHPNSDLSIGVGNPRDWQAEGNRIASDQLGKCTVFGHVHLLTKSRPRDKKRPATTPIKEPEEKAQKVV
jgi:hypothetical protein